MAMGPIALPKAARGLCVGSTGTGKTTLSEALIRQFQRDNPRARVLIIDSKPRFRAEWELAGITARSRYRKWGYGEYWPGSVRLPLDRPERELKAAWAAKYQTVIAQVDRLADLDLLRWSIDAFYEKEGAAIPRLLYIDEVADFFGTGGTARQGDSILRVARSGRERNVALLASSQRPRGIPKSLLTELSILYLFHLDFRQDIKHLQEMGLPEDIGIPPAGEHSFIYWSKTSRAEPMLYQMKR